MSKYGFLDVLEEEMDKVFPFDFEINWDKKNHVDEDAYLTAIPYEPKKGLSREFLSYFATFLRDTAELALDELMDFLADEEAESFEIVWNQEVFEEGKVGLEESTFYPYPRY